MSSGAMALFIALAFGKTPGLVMGKPLVTLDLQSRRSSPRTIAVATSPGTDPSAHRPRRRDRAGRPAVDQAERAGKPALGVLGERK